ncbi:hypothetical protein [Pararhizobium polonicum]|uniref:hypothetical protein n=1 Tax=Pararhizobium polonicum TaxID=1612624 RepID=UPI001314FB71|nr:hypothetical protein [Pararhizobium polonicum]
MNLPLGISLSVFSSVLFGVLYYFSTFLHSLTASEVFGWRLLLMSPFMTLYTCMSGDWRRIVTLIHRINVTMRLSSALLSVQQWLFLWAPMNGSALSVSLGYFILPPTMIGAGRLVYREKPPGLQQAAAIAVMIGAGHDVFRAGGLPLPPGRPPFNGS